MDDSPVDPVRNVQSPVKAERSEVVGGDGLRLAGSLEHEQLGQDGYALEPDGEGPGELEGGVAVGEEEGEDGDGGEEVGEAEGVERGVVSWSGI